MTAGGSGYEYSPGGIPELSSDDVKAALGIVQTRSKSRSTRFILQNKKFVPTVNTPIGILLVEARYLDDQASAETAIKVWQKRLFFAWYEYDVDPNETISIALMHRIAKIMVYDYCIPEHARRSGEAGLATAAGMDYRVWKRKFSKFYGHHMRELWAYEHPVIEDLIRVILRQV